MKKILFLLTLIPLIILAQNKTVSMGTKNCEDIATISKSYEKAIEKELSVNNDDIHPIKGIYDTRINSSGCRMLIQTSKGRFMCNINGIIDPQNGGGSYATDFDLGVQCSEGDESRH